MTGETFIGIVVSTVIAVIISFVFFKLGSRDLLTETRELRRINGVLLRAIRDERAEVVWDENGAPVALNYRLEAQTGELKVSGGVVSIEHRDRDGRLIEKR